MNKDKGASLGCVTVPSTRGGEPGKIPPLDPGRDVADIESYRSRFASRTKAEHYARRFEHGSRKRIDQHEHRALAGILSQLGHSGSILDVPCGAGRFLGLLGQYSDLVIEADISGEILTYSRLRHGEVRTACRYLQADASRLPFPDSSIDRVLCNRLLHHLRSASERAAIFKELHRIVRQYLIVSFFDYRSFGSLRSWLKRLKGRKPKYQDQPTRDQFFQETERQGFRLLFVRPVGYFWNAEKYVVLAKDQPR